jgi:PAS domain S-box-containing protein
MDEKDRPINQREELETRLKNLERQARFTYDVLEMASTLGDFQTNINQLQEPGDILRETSARIQGFIPFLTTAYYLVDENNQDFVLSLCLPEEQQPFIEKEVNHLIENGIFSLALRENRPIHVHSQSGKQRLVLHSLATSSRTRGMFVGLLGRTERTISGLVISLLSIILKNCANAIESFELYRLFRQNEQRYRELADFLPHTLFETDAQGLLQFVSQNALRQLGLEPKELIRRVRLQDLLAPGEADELQALQEQASKDPASKEVELAVLVRNAQGGNLALRARLRPMRSKGEFSGWRGVLMDPEPED